MGLHNFRSINELTRKDLVSIITAKHFFPYYRRSALAEYTRRYLHKRSEGY